MVKKYLEQSVISVIEQTYNNWELIFWNNVSDDNSKKIINKFTDRRIKYFEADCFKKLYEFKKLSNTKS